VAAGDKALFNGDYDLARSEYRKVLTDSTDPQLRAAAMWGLSRIFYEEANYPAALTQLRELTQLYPDTRDGAYGFFLLGETYYELDRFQEAAEAYGMYIEKRRGYIDAYAQEARGDALYNAGDYAGALEAYNLSLQSARLSDPSLLAVKIANAAADSGDRETALVKYDELFAQSGNDYLKAQLDYLAGNTLMTLGRTDEGYQRYLHAVENYPLSYYAYLSLVKLVDAGVPVDDFNRGIVDYYAGQYGAALAALDRYLARANPPDGTARHYRALALRATGNHEEAAAEWGRLIESHPDNRYWLDAWNEKAFTEWAYLDQAEKAAETLLDFVAVVSAHSDAPEMLFSAGRMYERANRLEDAIAAWQRVVTEYPTSPWAAEAEFQAGIACYRLKNLPEALTHIQRSLLLTSEPSDLARAHLWVGKIKAEQGEKSAAIIAWQQAVGLDPTGYYSERALDLMLGREPFEPPSTYDLSFDLEAERQEAASWLRVKFGLPPETDLNGPGPLLDDPRLWRGTEYWELGLKEQAQAEFESLREAVSEDAAGSFRLTGYLLDLGLYRSAVFAARQVLTLAGMDDAATLSAPVYFNHIRFGTYYADLVQPAAALNNLHPLFLFSVIRQESLFEGFVQSTADARGLMQIIPTTGSSIATNLGISNFRPEDLYRPVISIKFGANYLTRVGTFTGGNKYVILAGYNAGPGNADVWNSLAGGDPDLFVEVVRFAETRNYIRGIYEIFNIYRNLYNPLN
jgi:soluble lytic murein transglycosylase